MKKKLEALKEFLTNIFHSKISALVVVLLLVIALPIAILAVNTKTNTQQHASVALYGTCQGNGGRCVNVGHTCPSGFTSDYSDPTGSLANSCTGPTDSYCCVPDSAITCTPNVSKTCSSTSSTYTLYHVDSCGNKSEYYYTTCTNTQHAYCDGSCNCLCLNNPTPTPIPPYTGPTCGSVGGQCVESCAIAGSGWTVSPNGNYDCTDGNECCIPPLSAADQFCQGKADGNYCSSDSTTLYTCSKSGGNVSQTCSGQQTCGTSQDGSGNKACVATGGGGGGGGTGGTSGNITGYFDAADCSAGLQGWACDQNNGSTSLTVNFYTDSGFTNKVGSTVANIPRPDVAAAKDCQSTPNHGFAFQVPDSLRTGSQQTVYAAAIDGSGNTIGLNTSPKQFTCSTNGGGGSSGSHTYLNLAVQLPGLGAQGDDNKNFKHGNTRKINIAIYGKDANITDVTTQPIVDPIKNITITYNTNNGFFTNSSIDLGTNIPDGDYQVLIKAPQFLRHSITLANSSDTTIHLTPGQTISTQVTLIPGDVAPFFNVLDVQDFNAIVSCFGKSVTDHPECVNEDINDDGQVNGIDLNLMLRGMRMLHDAGSTTYTGEGAPGE